MPKEGIICKSCGRFVGAYERCPHCQAKIMKTVSLLLVKRIVVVGAILGLAAMYVAAKVKEVPRMDIGAIEMNHNMALVDVQGRIVNMTRQVERNAFNFTVTDDSGLLKVLAFNRLNLFEQAFGQDFPGVGDEVMVRGNLAISEKFGASIFLSNPKRLKILKRYRITEQKIGRIGKQDINMVYRFTAQTQGPIFQNDVLRSIPMRDDTGKLPFVVFKTEFATIPEKSVRDALVTTGTTMRFLARISEYKGVMQLKCVRASDPATFEILDGQKED